jgi:hypothetical protein
MFLVIHRVLTLPLNPLSSPFFSLNRCPAGWRGEFSLRGASAPLGGLLPLNNGAFKRGENPSSLLSPSQTKEKFEYFR